METFLIIMLVLLALEVGYFRIADKLNIIDRPNERSSHTKVVLQGGGIIFTLGLWLWSMVFGFLYPWLLTGVTLAAGVSFVDDIRPLPISVRLAIQLVASALVFQEIGLLHWEIWYVVAVAMFVCVGMVNIYNFMDGVNGMTGGYSLVVLISLLLLNRKYGLMEESMLVVTGLSLMVFCFFNFRTKPRCFSGDVGSIGIALIMVFGTGRLIWVTGDVTWIVLFLLYLVDGSLTICHRVMLHENLGQAHRKHVYQIMANELKVKHVMVSGLYMALQMAISLIVIYVVPDTSAAHWAYLVGVTLVLSLAYVQFMRKYYQLHADYLASLQAKRME